MLESFAAPLALAALAVGSVAALLALIALRRARPPERRPWPELTDVEALEAYLTEERERSDRMAGELEAVAGSVRSVEAVGRRAVQHVGLVRYNPFEDTGSNQSFALALLDADANGIVLSSLHSRQQTRVYLKEIVAGRCEAALSTEESEALRRAGVAD